MVTEPSGVFVQNYQTGTNCKLTSKTKFSLLYGHTIPKRFKSRQRSKVSASESVSSFMLKTLKPRCRKRPKGGVFDRGPSSSLITSTLKDITPLISVGQICSWQRCKERWYLHNRNRRAIGVINVNN